MTCTDAPVQSLILTRPAAQAVAHVILTVPRDKTGAPQTQEMLTLLQDKARPTFGQRKATELFCSLGFTRTGLALLGVPVEYRQLFLEFAPEYFEGAGRRLDRLGDAVSDGDAPGAWPELAPARADAAHVLVSWHGSIEQVDAAVEGFEAGWRAGLRAPVPVARRGRTMVGPKGEPHWLHFGYRDGISEVCLTGLDVPEPPLDPRHHAPGELLLGHPDDEGVNTFGLTFAYAQVRAFFRDSSFGVLRPMSQDVEAFEDWVAATVATSQAQLGVDVDADFVRAKLCGRWPGGQQMRPGDVRPPRDPSRPEDFRLDFQHDRAGEGCPFSAHVRRLRGQADRSGPAIARPLQRRSVPFGDPVPSERRQTDDAEGRPDDRHERGLIGHFFCASIAVQFEHLLGQWLARAPLDRPPQDQAADPLTGPRDGDGGSMVIPIKGRADGLPFSGFKDWTRPLGTLYAWYPGIEGWTQMLEGTYDVDKDVWRESAGRQGHAERSAAAADRNTPA